MIRKFALAAIAGLVAAAALSPSAALAGGGKHKFFHKHHFHPHIVSAPIVVADPCYVTKWYRTPFGLQKKVIFVCY